MPVKQSTFIMRRISCLGDDYAEVKVSVDDSAPQFEFVSEIAANQFDSDIFVRCMEKGIIEAFNVAQIDKQNYRVTLESARDLRDETTAMAFHQCAFGATLQALGKPELAPDPGPV